MTQNSIIETRTLSSLEKVFADEELTSVQWNKGSLLSNEVYSFQVAYKWKHGEANTTNRVLKNIQVKVISSLESCITIRRVGLVPSEMPCYAEHDNFISRDTPGLYPDPLYNINDEGISLPANQWRSIWVTVRPENQVKTGIYPIEIVFLSDKDEELGKAVFLLTILSEKLPKQSLIHTEWFHTDCLAIWYKTKVFSDEYWKRVEQYLETAVRHGINMILTPLFTPPLDTVVGGERLTVQLVGVGKKGDNYDFDFDKLQKWVNLCNAKGVGYFEFSHLFTQWGAKHAPKIMAVENGELKRIFGWETDASGDEYKSFLGQFLPALIQFIEKNGLKERSYFHVSDEPGKGHIESYGSASNIINKYLYEYPVIDALSSYEFYEKGIVKRPIPANNHIEPFLESKVPDLWTYYCCVQYDKVSNRFFNMPSARNRIIGIQMYKFNIKGFLHWGYNFWYSQFSRYPIDPFRTTDAEYAYPSGDAFVVYPDEGGPIESLRLEVFYEALQDLRALKLLEEKIGREAVLNILEENLDNPITFSEYPREPEWLLMKREQINRKIIECT